MESNRYTNEDIALYGLGERGVWRTAHILDAGGQGTVYLAEGNSGPAALKLNEPFDREGKDKAAAEEARAAFAFEAKVLGWDHPNVVKVKALDERATVVTPSHPTFPATAMEYASKGSLAKIIENQGGRLETGQASHYYLPMLRGYEYVHAQRVTLRDIKPNNVLVRSDDTVAITDFGASIRLRNVDSANITTKLPFGTLPYMPPEAFDGKKLTAASDIYSAALSGYELYTGRRPFSANNLAALVGAILKGNIPRFEDFTDITMTPTLEKLEEVLRTGMNKHVAQRYKTMSRFHTAVAVAIEEGRALETTVHAPSAPSKGRQRGAPRTRRYTNKPFSEGDNPGGPVAPKRGRPGGPGGPGGPARPPRGDQKVASQGTPRGGGPGGPGGRPGRGAPKVAQPDQKKDIDWFDRNADKSNPGRRKVLIGLGSAGVTLAAASAGGFLELRNGWKLTPDPEKPEYLKALSDRDRLNAVRIGDDLSTFILRQKAYGTASMAAETLAPIHLGSSIAISQQLFKAKKYGDALQAAAYIAPYRPDFAENMLRSVVKLLDLNQTIPDTVRNLAVALAPSRPDAAREVVRMFHERPNTYAALDIAIAPSSGFTNALLKPPISDVLVPDSSLPTLFPRLAQYNPKTLLNLYHDVQLETTEGARIGRAIGAAFVPYQPDLAESIMLDLEKSSEDVRRFGAAYIAICSAPYNISITRRAYERFQARADNATSFLTMALSRHMPDLARQELKSTTSPLWKALLTNAVHPTSKSRAELIKQLGFRTNYPEADAYWAMQSLVKSRYRA